MSATHASFFKSSTRASLVYRSRLRACALENGGARVSRRVPRFGGPSRHRLSCWKSLFALFVRARRRRSSFLCRPSDAEPLTPRHLPERARASGRPSESVETVPRVPVKERACRGPGRLSSTGTPHRGLPDPFAGILRLRPRSDHDALSPRASPMLSLGGSPDLDPVLPTGVHRWPSWSPTSPVDFCRTMRPASTIASLRSSSAFLPLLAKRQRVEARAIPGRIVRGRAIPGREAARHGSSRPSPARAPFVAEPAPSRMEHPRSFSGRPRPRFPRSPATVDAFRQGPVPSLTSRRETSQRPRRASPGGPRRDPGSAAPFSTFSTIRP